MEKASADLVLVAGGDDAVWPSETFARDLVSRRESLWQISVALFEQGAGERILLPGETTPRSQLRTKRTRDSVRMHGRR
ncbi:hypothetical protein C1D09_010435 [Mesorhizobium intechi]|uniref:Uncharacterized protein n=1 Tax=Mesorhizobium intechi TaxID=537601 RepID=A0A8T9AVW8_9HYPH|nr:hypothetical protein C1D09_010435 [Mesorhizobium intechi]